MSIRCKRAVAISMLPARPVREPPMPFDDPAEWGGGSERTDLRQFAYHGDDWSREPAQGRTECSRKKGHWRPPRAAPSLNSGNGSAVDMCTVEITMPAMSAGLSSDRRARIVDQKRCVESSY